MPPNATPLSPPGFLLALLRDFLNDHHPLIADKITRVDRVNCSTEAQPSGHPLDIQPGSHMSRLYLGRDRRFDHKMVLKTYFKEATTSTVSSLEIYFLVYMFICLNICIYFMNIYIFCSIYIIFTSSTFLNIYKYIYIYMCIIFFDVPFQRMVMVQWKMTLMLKEIHLGDTSISPRKAMIVVERLSW